MQTVVTQGQRGSWLRAAVLLAGLVALEAGILRLVGPVSDQVRTLGRVVADPAVEPVSGFLDLLAVVTELVAAYLAVVLVLRMLARLPGALGRLACGGLRRLALPVVRRALDGLVGGALLAQVTLSPAQAWAGTGPSGVVPRTVAATAAPHALGSWSEGGAVGRPGALPTASTVPGPPPWILGTAGREAWPGPAPASATVVGPAGPSTVPPSTVAPGAPVPPPMVPPVGPRDGRVVPNAAPGGASAGAPSPSGTGTPDARQHGVHHGLHTVRPGDTLWGIAAAHLPAGSRSPAQVDRYWRQIYAANRAAIGSDPDLIHPGTRLKVPAFRPVPADHR
jgi:resuscitation-promoting factor RpfA